MKKRKKSAGWIWPALGLIILLAAVGGVLLRERAPETPADWDPGADGKLIVCLDAGHGGHDAGAVDGERMEKDDNLRLALAVRQALNARRPDIETVLTRGEDVFVTLQDRCRIANEHDCDLFVSFHRNSAEKAHGAEIWANSARREVDACLAGAIRAGLKKVGVSDDRGVKYGTVENANGNYYVLAHTEMPSCLVELGFMNSEEDNELFDKRLEQYAAAIAEALDAMLPANK